MACSVNYFRYVAKVVVKRGGLKAYWRRKNPGIPENSTFVTGRLIVFPQEKDHRDYYSGLRTTDYSLNVKRGIVKAVAVCGTQIANDKNASLL